MSNRIRKAEPLKSNKSKQRISDVRGWLGAPLRVWNSASGRYFDFFEARERAQRRGDGGIMP